MFVTLCTTAHQSCNQMNFTSLSAILVPYVPSSCHPPTQTCMLSHPGQIAQLLRCVVSLTCALFVHLLPYYLSKCILASPITHSNCFVIVFCLATLFVIKDYKNFSYKSLNEITRAHKSLNEITRARARVCVCERE